MKWKPTSTADSISGHDVRIDAALNAYARAIPAPGLESRVAARVAVARRHPTRSMHAARVLILQRFSCGTLAAAAACGIVVASVQHSHRAALPPIIRFGDSGGVGAAGAVHVPTRRTPQTPSINPAAPRTPPRSRAVVSPNSGHHAGAAVPRSPYPSAAQR